MGYAFGQALTVWFFPLVDNEPAVIPAELQAQAPTIYVFPARPSQENAASGDGALGPAITAWTYDAVRQGFYFTVPAIDDPQPTATIPSVLPYYLGITFQLSASEQPQTIVQYLPMERVRSVAKDVSVTENDLRGIFSGVDSVSTSPQKIAKILEAKRLVKIYFKNKTYEWSRIHNLEDLNSAVAYKALSLIMLGESLGQGDQWFIKYIEFKETATGFMDSLKLEYDTDGDNVPDVQTSTSDSVRLLLR